MIISANDPGPANTSRIDTIWMFCGSLLGLTLAADLIGARLVVMVGSRSSGARGQWRLAAFKSYVA